MFNRKQHSKMITNSLIMVYFFYILLAATSQGFFLLFFPGWIAQHILLIPILIGNLGLCWGIYNLTYDPLVKWTNAKKSIIYILIGAGLLLLSTVLLILTEFLPLYSSGFSILLLIGIILLVLANPLFAFGYYLFKKDLKKNYFDKYISKFPTIYISLSYLVQSLGFISMLIAALFENTLGDVFFIVGLVIVIISILGLGVGFYPLFIAFRTYPQILELIEEQQMKKQQTPKAKKSKKAS